MRRLSFLIFGAIVFVGGLGVRSQTTCSASADGKTVYVGGMSAGFTLKTGGAQVIGFSEVITKNGTKSPALLAGVKTGDRIKKAEGISIENIGDLNEIVEKSRGKCLRLEIARGEAILELSVQPSQEAVSGKYKLGVLVRDSLSGIGTVTYIDKTAGRFGALGHSVDGEDRRCMQLSKTAVYACSIVGVSKGVRGKAGELRGMFLSDKCIGAAEKLCSCGIFGRISETFSTDGLLSAVADSQNAKPGKAVIYSTVSGVEIKRYTIEIVKVDKGNRENKNYVIKITDADLIEETGGIVQGMSGSPILQDGQLVGAITHVFLNDPTRGYGIDIDKMLGE